MIKNFGKPKILKWVLSFVFPLLTITWGNASHLRAGQITVVRSGCNTREVFITIKVYTNYVDPRTDVQFGQDGILSFGDGKSIVIEGKVATPAPELGPNIGIAYETITYTYAAPGSYLISYVEPNRNGGVLNMDNSFFTTFYLETLFDLSIGGCNNSPELKIPPIDQACAGVAFFHNPGAVDLNGPGSPSDSLSYELVVPFKDRGRPVDGYISPDNSRFSQNNEIGGDPTFSIDPVDGTMVWDSPHVPGEYNVAFNVIEWRKIQGEWKRIGYVRRDMQIIVNGDCENERPILRIPDDTCVVAGANINKFIRGEDQFNAPDGPDQIKIQAYSEIFEYPASKSPATRTPVLRDGDDIDFFNSPLDLEFNWNTICDHIRGQPYDVVFKVTDKPDQGPNLATFQTWKITVVAPPPVLSTANVQIPQRFVQLNWAGYDCSSIADGSSVVQIWRRVDDTSYTPTTCDTGMPESLGFSLIATVPLTATSFLDNNGGDGLERGVKYCYRLVASFPNRGAESPVSNEVCIDPIDIAAPLITKVTVDKTGETDGEITVHWIPPLNPELRPGINLEDYRYELQRAQGTGFIAVSPRMDDGTLSFTDNGLNTFDRQYFYRVMLYVDGATDPIDSSSIASSVWLGLTTSNRVINLNWDANVPWSNQIQSMGQKYKHIVYSVPEDATTLVDTVRIATIDVTVEGLQYADIGLDSTKKFCYAVMTKGSYGNDAQELPDPIKNVSQINCAVPVTQNPPCEPIIAAFGEPCKDFFVQYACNSTVFNQQINWSMPENCNDNISHYEVWRASTSDIGSDGYSLIAVVTDTFFLHKDLISLAQCYRIKAVDRSGNRSNFSDKVCSENCPNYELPNVFTPNGDKCNDFFSAFGVDLDTPEIGSDCKVPINDEEYTRKCARFVRRVDFKVFNRWGKEIYNYVGQRNNENSIYINWDGRDKTGKELATGIYFYTADVTFESTGPGGETVKTIKGWVHLVR